MYRIILEASYRDVWFHCKDIETAMKLVEQLLDYFEPNDDVSKLGVRIVKVGEEECEEG